MRVGPQEDDTDEQTENVFGKIANFAQDAVNFVKVLSTNHNKDINLYAL